MQTVLQEAGPQSSGRGQSQGHDRGGLQETRAHKVRTRVCRQIKVKKSVTPFVVIEDQTLRVFFLLSSSSSPALLKDPSLSFSSCSLSSSSRGIQSLSPAGRCSSRRGEKRSVRYLSLKRSKKPKVC